MPGEGEGPKPDTGYGGGGGSGPNYDDFKALLDYVKGINFGNDGDYTGNAGYGGDNIGPPGSKEPEKDVDRATEWLNVLMAPPGKIPGAPQRPGTRIDRSREIDPYGGAEAAKRSLFDFVGAEVDVYSGLRLGFERPDPFTGLPPSDPFAAERPRRGWSAAPFATLRQRSLLSSPYLLADNASIACNDRLASCPPEMKSDFNQSSLGNLVQDEMNQSYVATLNIIEGKRKIIGSTEVDMHKIAATAAATAQSDEYKLAFAINQLRDHPLEIRHSPVVAGLGHMGAGLLLMGGSAVAIVYSGGVMLPLGGAMGFAAGTAEVASGFALAISGADSTETVRMSGQLDYVFDLTSSPVKLMSGTTGLVLSGGDVGVSHRFAIIGGFAEDAMRFRGDPSKLYSAVVPGVGTKAEKGASALLLRNMASAGTRAHAGSTTSTMGSLPPLRSPSVAEEAASRFHDSVRQAEAFLREHPEMIEQLGGRHTGARVTIGQLGAASNEPAFARALAGNAMEAMVDAINTAHPAADAGFIQVGGANKIDFIGWGRFAGLTFELTTEAAVVAHAGRLYVQQPGAMIFTYTLCLP